MVILSITQGRIAWHDAQLLSAAQMKSAAWLIAEQERDAFVIARQAVVSLSEVETVQRIGSDCTQALVNAHRGTIGIVNVIRSDAAGQVRCSALPFAGPVTFARDPWWQHAVKAKGLSLSAPVIGRISGRTVTVVALPLQTARGTQDGLISASIGLDTLRASLQRRSRIDPSALIEIVDGNGAVLLSNRKAALRLDDKSNGTEGSATARAADGSEWLYAKVPLQGKNLSVVYAKPRETILGAALSQVRQSVLLPLLAIGLASIAIWFGSHWLGVRWLRRLQTLTNQFARGEFTGNRAAFALAPQEVSALSDDLHAMADTIAARDAALNAAVNAKTALTREVNHRVKNNLQIVTSLLTLQADRVADPWARDALGQARARIAALGLIHRVLYERDTYNEQGTVDMQLLLAELCPQLRTANRARANIALDCTSDDLMLSVDRAVPLTLFLVEAVTNAFRHAFADDRPGTIRTAMTTAGDHVLLTVTDDGDGYQVASSVNGMGTELMKAFATQLNGTLTIDSGSAGTAVTLRYPLVSY
ncbi:MAG: sensor histidine kinase [Sphingomonadaceae bacterium]